MIIRAYLDGDFWRVAAPPGSAVERDAGPPFRERLSIPGVLGPLTTWQVIEYARERLLGLRVVGHSVYGLDFYVVEVPEVGTLPLFPEAS
jgi:hypothetical protein